MVAISSLILVRLAIAAGFEAALFIANRNERTAGKSRARLAA